MSALSGARVAAFAVIALVIFSGVTVQTLVRPASGGIPHADVTSTQATSSPAPTVSAAVPVRPPAFDPKALLHLHPLAGLPSASFFSGVGAFTTDPLVVNNTGINTTITLPASFNPPAKGCVTISLSGFSGLLCAFLGVEEPFNATSTAAIGAAITEITASGVQTLHILPVGILPNGTFIYSKTLTGLTLGQSHTFSILHSSGTWWEFESDLAPITGNGTYNLNATHALGISQKSQGAPAELMAEFGNSSFQMPEVKVPSAIGIELNGTSSLSYQPVTGNAILLNASYPLGIQGHDQLASIPRDSVNEGGALTFPGILASLWGHHNPLGVFTPQAGAYTDETAAGGNTGIGLTVTVPSTTEPAGTADLLGVQMPVNYTIEVGVGVSFSGALATPYYMVRNGLSTSLYVSRTQTVSSGTSLNLEASLKGSGWWAFTENGNLIINATSGPGNGTAFLGLNAAATYLGATYAPNTSYFAESTFPMLALYGNGTMSSVNATVGMQFQLSGRGWMIPDYAYGYSWNQSVGEQSALPTPSHLARGDVILGSSVSVVTSTPPLLWKGEIGLNDARASPASVVSGQNSTIRVNLTSGMAVPSNGNVCAVVSTSPGTGCGTMIFMAGVSGTNWTVYAASFVAPMLTSATPLTVTFTIQASPSPPVYAYASATATLTVVPPVLKVQVQAYPSTVTAGTTSVIDVWVNDTLAPVSGARVNATPSVPGLGAIATATSTAGLYTDTFTPLISITTQATYQVTFSANKSGAVEGTAVLSLTAVPLPQLTVQVMASSGSAAVTAGAPVIFNVTVTSSSGVAESGAAVSLAINPSSSSWSGTTTGISGPGGLLELELTAPSVTTATAFNVSATATLGGFRGGSGQTIVNVKAASGPVQNSGILNGILLYVVIGAVVVAAAVTMLLLMRKKKTPPSTGQENYPSEPAPEGQGVPDAPWEQPPQQT